MAGTRTVQSSGRTTALLALLFASISTGEARGTPLSKMTITECASVSIFSDAQAALCTLVDFHSQDLILTAPVPVTEAQFFGLFIGGSPTVSYLLSFDSGGIPQPISAGGFGGFVLPLVQLSEEPGDLADLLGPDGLAIAVQFNPGGCLDGGGECGAPEEFCQR